MNRENIDNFFKDLKKHYKNNKYTIFFKYFSGTCLITHYPKKLWNYNDIVKNENNNKLFLFTNNITENINRFLNSNLKLAKCSNVLFRETILKIIKQLENKTENYALEKKTGAFIILY